MVLPNTSFVDSNDSKVIGTFVLTNGTAPASFRSLISAESFCMGFPTHAEYPMHESSSATPTVSLTLTGMPASGPLVLHVFAQPSALAISTSVRQFVAACPFSAFLL